MKRHKTLITSRVLEAMVQNHLQEKYRKEYQQATGWGKNTQVASEGIKFAPPCYYNTRNTNENNDRYLAST